MIKKIDSSMNLPKQLPRVGCQKKLKGLVPHPVSHFNLGMPPLPLSLYVYLRCRCTAYLITYSTAVAASFALPRVFGFSFPNVTRYRVLVDTSLFINKIFKNSFFLLTGNRLNEYILHYETLDYDTNVVAVQHSRHRRAAGVETGTHHVHVDFHSHGKPFRLKLKRDTTTFSSDIQIVSHQGQPLDVDTSHLYEGHLQGETCYFAHLLFYSRNYTAIFIYRIYHIFRGLGQGS